MCKMVGGAASWSPQDRTCPKRHIPVQTCALPLSTHLELLKQNLECDPSAPPTEFHSPCLQNTFLTDTKNHSTSSTTESSRTQHESRDSRQKIPSMETFDRGKKEKEGCKELQMQLATGTLEVQCQGLGKALQDPVVGTGNWTFVPCQSHT